MKSDFRGEVEVTINRLNVKIIVQLAGKRLNDSVLNIAVSRYNKKFSACIFPSN